MRFALICTDKPGHLEVRIANREAHLAWLGQSAGVEMAGPFLDADSNMTGSMLIIEAADLAAARAWADADPYAKAGLFQSVDIRAWKKVIG